MASSLERLRQAGSVSPMPSPTVPAGRSLDRLRALESQSPDDLGFFDRMLPSPEGRAFLAESVQAVPRAIGDFARQQAGITATHYRNLANLPYSPLGEDQLGLVARPTPEAQADYNQEFFEGVLTAAGGLVGRGIGAKAADAMKYLGRGFRSIPGAERFLAQEAAHITTTPPAGAWKSLVTPAVTGTVTERVVNAMDPTPYEFTDAPVAGGAGVAAAAAVGKNAVDDLLLSSDRWRRVMMSPSKGTASGILGALLGFGVAQGALWSKDQIASAIEYVSSMFDDDEGNQDAAP